MCVYIGGMVDDLELTVANFDKDSTTTSMTKRLATEIAFHNEILEWVSLHLISLIDTTNN